MRVRRFLKISWAAALVAAGAAACSGGGGSNNSVTGPSSQPTTSGNTVQATPQLAFMPHDVTIKSGQSVTWAFGSVAHTVIFDTTATSVTSPSGGGNPYPTGNLVVGLIRASVQAGAPADISETSNASVSRAFGTAGTFTYHCRIHPQMTGRVIVQ